MGQKTVHLREQTEYLVSSWGVPALRGTKRGYMCLYSLHTDSSSFFLPLSLANIACLKAASLMSFDRQLPASGTLPRSRRNRGTAPRAAAAAEAPAAFVILGPTPIPRKSGVEVVRTVCSLPRLKV